MKARLECPIAKSRLKIDRTCDCCFAFVFRPHTTLLSSSSALQVCNIDADDICDISRILKAQSFVILPQKLEMGITSKQRTIEKDIGRGFKPLHMESPI